LNITNLPGGDPIQQVWIYKNPEYDDFTCEPITGWNLAYQTVFQPGTSPQITTDACQWVAQAGLVDGFDDGNTKVFKFNATTPDDLVNPEETCGLKWYVQTIDSYPGDTSGQAKMNFDVTGIDDEAPVVTSSIGEPNVSLNNLMYIKSETPITITASEEELLCQSGIDECEWSYTRTFINNQGDVETETISGIEYGNGEPIHSWDMTFPKDSNHTLTVQCTDVAGHESNEHSIDFIVDNTPPVTKPGVDGPFHEGTYNNKPALFLNGISNVTLHPEDIKFPDDVLVTE
jgi:hypothetical protein